MQPSELHDRVRRDLLAYVIDKHPVTDRPVTFDTPLLERGIVDSLSMAAFIAFLERRYQLDFMKVEVTRDDFASIDVLARLVVANLPAGAPAGAGG
jgi:acyl carrier protein